MAKINFQQPLLQSSVSQYPNMLIWCSRDISLFIISNQGCRFVFLHWWVHKSRHHYL